MKHKILVVVFLVILILGAVVLMKDTTENDVSNTTEAETVTLVTSQNWLTYSNDKFGISFEYPSDWTYRQIETAETNALGVKGLDVSFIQGGTNTQVFNVMVTPSQYVYRSEGMGDGPRFVEFESENVCDGLKLCEPTSLINGRGAFAYRTTGPIDGGGSIGFAKYARIERSFHTYSGIEFFGAQIDSCRYGANNWKACYGPGAVGDSPYTHENGLVYQQYMASKIQKGLISEDAQKNVAILDHMVNSLQLSQ